MSVYIYIYTYAQHAISFRDVLETCFLEQHAKTPCRAECQHERNGAPDAHAAIIGHSFFWGDA